MDPTQEAMVELRAALREEIHGVVRTMLPELKQAVLDELATRINAVALAQADGVIKSLMTIIGKTMKKAAAQTGDAIPPADAISSAEGQPAP